MIHWMGTIGNNKLTILYDKNFCCRCFEDSRDRSPILSSGETQERNAVADHKGIDTTISSSLERPQKSGPKIRQKESYNRNDTTKISAVGEAIKKLFCHLFREYRKLCFLYCVIATTPDHCQYRQ